MRYRAIITTLLLTAFALQSAAQALTDRYNNRRPVVIACEKDMPFFTATSDGGRAADCYMDIMRAVADRVGVPCRFVISDEQTAEEPTEGKEADLILTGSHSYAAPDYSVSETVVSYHRVSADSIAEIHFVGKDKQLVDQMDAQYMQLMMDGTVAAIREQCMQTARDASEPLSAARIVMIGFLLLAAVAGVACLLVLAITRSSRRRLSALDTLISQTRQVAKNYKLEDSNATHELVNRHDAILCNPFVAIALYDSEGRLIVQNDAMRQAGSIGDDSLRQPLYNADGQVANYIVAVSRP